MTKSRPQLHALQNAPAKKMKNASGARSAVEQNEKVYTLFIAPEPLNTRCDAREKCRQFLGKESGYWYGNKDLLYLQEEEAPPPTHQACSLLA